MCKLYLYLVAFSLWTSTTSQMTEEIPSDPEEAEQHLTEEITSNPQNPEQHPRRLLLDTPCLPCYVKDNWNRCRKIYGCEDDVGNVTDSPEEAGVSGALNDSSKISGLQYLPPDDSLCKPCYEIDYMLRCRRIIGCVVPTTASPTSSDPSSTSHTGEANPGNSSDTSQTLDEIGFTTEFSEMEVTMVNSTLSPQQVKITSGTNGDISSVAEEISSPTPIYISDIPLIKTLAPQIPSHIPTTTDPNGNTTETLTKMQTSQATNEEESDIANVTNINQDQKVTDSVIASYPSAEQTSSTERDILNTTTSISSTTPTDTETTTATGNPCLKKNFDGSFGVDIVCYFKYLLKLNR